MWRRAVSSWLAELPVAEMPSPRGLPLVGTTLDLLAAGSAPRLHEYVDSRHKQLGPVFRDKIGPVQAVFVSDPIEMRRVFTLEGKYPVHHLPDPWVLYGNMYGSKRGLFFMEGEEWLHYRRIMNKLMLRPGSEQSLVESCDVVADDLVSHWSRRYSGKELCNLHNGLYVWSINNMLAVMLGDKYEQHHKDLEDTVQQFAVVVHQIFEESSQLSLIPAKLAAFFNIPAWKRFVSSIDKAIELANNLMTKLIPECREGNGLLRAMLREGIEHRYVVRIMADLILAAGDTTAYTTQWMLYLLAKDTQLQEEIYKEVKTASSNDHIVQLPLLRGVLRETLRLYPVAPFLTRYLPQDCLIGGYHVPAKELVLLSLYSSGRDSKNFPEPNKFWPQRWCRDADDGNYKGVHSPYASLPFAMGARSCIGRRIAEVQTILTIAKVIQQFKLELIDKEQVDMILRLVAVPSRPIRLWLTMR